MTLSIIYLAILDHQSVPFAERALAERVAEQWNSDHAETLRQWRAHGCHSLADSHTARLETADADTWARTGPGGLAAVWTRMPDRRLVYSRSRAYNPAGEIVTDVGLVRRWTWESEPDSYTTRPAVWHIERRPGPAALIEVHIKGVDAQAVEQAWLAACEEALRHCTPKGDTWP